MKTIKDVDSKPTHFQDDVPQEVIDQMPSYRKMFKAAIAMGLAKDGENAIDLMQLGLKFKLADPDISLEDAEFKLLKDRCSQNTPSWQAHFHAQVMLKLKDAEKSKE